MSNNQAEKIPNLALQALKKKRERPTVKRSHDLLTPETPSISKTPLTPETPSTLEVSATPETSATSGTSTTPETPAKTQREVKKVKQTRKTLRMDSDAAKILRKWTNRSDGNGDTIVEAALLILNKKENEEIKKQVLELAGERNEVRRERAKDVREANMAKKASKESAKRK